MTLIKWRMGLAVSLSALIASALISTAKAANDSGSGGSSASSGTAYGTTSGGTWVQNSKGAWTFIPKDKKEIPPPSSEELDENTIAVPEGIVVNVGGTWTYESDAHIVGGESGGGSGGDDSGDGGGTAPSGGGGASPPPAQDGGTIPTGPSPTDVSGGAGSDSGTTDYDTSDSGDTGGTGSSDTGFDPSQPDNTSELFKEAHQDEFDHMRLDDDYSHLGDSKLWEMLRDKYSLQKLESVPPPPPPLEQSVSESNDSKNFLSPTPGGYWKWNPTTKTGEWVSGGDFAIDRQEGHSDASESVHVTPEALREGTAALMTAPGTPGEVTNKALQGAATVSSLLLSTEAQISDTPTEPTAPISTLTIPSDGLVVETKPITEESGTTTPGESFALTEPIEPPALVAEDVLSDGNTAPLTTPLSALTINSPENSSDGKDTVPVYSTPTSITVNGMDGNDVITVDSVVSAPLKILSPPVPMEPEPTTPSSAAEPVHVTPEELREGTTALIQMATGFSDEDPSDPDYSTLGSALGATQYVAEKIESGEIVVDEPKTEEPAKEPTKPSSEDALRPEPPIIEAPSTDIQEVIGDGGISSTKPLDATFAEESVALMTTPTEPRTPEVLVEETTTTTTAPEPERLSPPVPVETQPVPEPEPPPTLGTEGLSQTVTIDLTINEVPLDRVTPPSVEVPTLGDLAQQPEVQSDAMPVGEQAPSMDAATLSENIPESTEPAVPSVVADQMPETTPILVDLAGELEASPDAVVALEPTPELSVVVEAKPKSEILTETFTPTLETLVEATTPEPEAMAPEPVFEVASSDLTAEPNPEITAVVSETPLELKELAVTPETLPPAPDLVTLSAESSTLGDLAKQVEIVPEATPPTLQVVEDTSRQLFASELPQVETQQPAIESSELQKLAETTTIMAEVPPAPSIQVLAETLPPDLSTQAPALESLVVENTRESLVSESAITQLPTPELTPIIEARPETLAEKIEVQASAPTIEPVFEAPKIETIPIVEAVVAAPSPVIEPQPVVYTRPSCEPPPVMAGPAPAEGSFFSGSSSPLPQKELKPDWEQWRHNKGFIYRKKE